MYRFTEVLFPVANISIFKIVYIQFHGWKQQFYDSKASSKDMHTCVNFTALRTKNNPETIDTLLIDYSSTFTNVLIWK